MPSARCSIPISGRPGAWCSTSAWAASRGHAGVWSDARALCQEDRAAASRTPAPRSGSGATTRSAASTRARSSRNAGNDGPSWRTVHIGLDLFAPPGTPVLAPLDGVVHSVADNASPLDYGPTVILEHEAGPGGPPFYTLYGHLSRGARRLRSARAIASAPAPSSPGSARRRERRVAAASALPDHHRPARPPRRLSRAWPTRPSAACG